MRIIARKRLVEWGRQFADARAPLADWAEKVEAAVWESLDETRGTFSAADQVMVGSGRPVTVFNLKGNRYRLVAAIHYDKQRVYVMRFMTHAEYDKDTWKDTL